MSESANADDAFPKSPFHRSTILATELYTPAWNQTGNMTASCNSND